MKLRTYRMFQAMIMTALGFFLLQRFWSGQLIIYIHRRFIWLALLAALTLIALAQAMFNNRPPIREEKDGMLVNREAPRGSGWRLLMMLVPLLLGLFVPVRSLGAEAAESRQVSQAVTLTAGSEVKDTVLTMDPGSRSLLEWLWTFDITEDKSTLAGQPVRLEGFVLRNETLPEGQFMVARFIITCCVADASAIGIPVQPPGDPDSQLSGWIRVEGVMSVAESAGRETPLILAETIQSIPEPDQPYLYQ